MEGLVMQSQRVRSYVVFDLETTGLPRELPRVTEISAMAFTREQLLAANKSGELLPRVNQQINFCVNPTKAIHPVASKITGLTNDMLQNEKPFDEGLVEVLTQMMERLPQPVCLVAHNGNGFDFPILQAELSRLNKQFPDNVLCADSLIAFREHFPRGDTKPLTVINENGTKKRKTGKVLKSHALKDLYQFLVTTSKMLKAHSAGGDVEALTKCLASQGNLFPTWADKNAVLFNSIAKLW